MTHHNFHACQPIRHGPVTYPYAREMHIADPDGNVIRVGSDPDA